ncbi:hypothetical protein Palpr_2672 [Paludibacter propionicigenes WB4]|uniref:Uncharacterized protein n=1 Tax=Paludibacter propionicigenes (strain DSM 17365 / JCM 13257 / WB4) TaxID=694427 RepID=E4T7V8_PALPW|nr:hypothetical protein [Paludibacter propionicigenes]ADQ80802.1 hypothetical protein Palpr_2672 [Paludibacter propionicigenes WB4]
MENITCAAELKIAIIELEFQQNIQGKLLQEDFFIAYENLKPANLIKNTLSEITSSPYLIDNMLSALTGLLSGYVSKKIAIGTSHNLFRKIMGTVLQFGVTNIVAQNPDALKALGNFVIQHLFKKNEDKTENL